MDECAMKAKKDRLSDFRMWHREDSYTGRTQVVGGAVVQDSVTEQNGEIKNTVWKTLNMK